MLLGDGPAVWVSKTLRDHYPRRHRGRGTGRRERIPEVKPLTKVAAWMTVHLDPRLGALPSGGLCVADFSPGVWKCPVAAKSLAGLRSLPLDSDCLPWYASTMTKNEMRDSLKTAAARLYDACKATHFSDEERDDHIASAVDDVRVAGKAYAEWVPSAPITDVNFWMNEDHPEEWLIQWRHDGQPMEARGDFIQIMAELQSICTVNREALDID